MLKKAGPPAGDALKECAERGTRHVPGEILAAHVFVSRLIPADAGIGNPWRVRLWIAPFAICAVLTPVYLWRMANPGQPKTLHLDMATIAFAGRQRRVVL